MGDWHCVRSQIEHEDGLINQRMTWAIQINQMLLAAFAAGVWFLVGNQNRGRVTAPVLIVLFILMGFAIVTNLITFRSVRMANRQIERLVAWWETQSKGSGQFPPLIGRPDSWIDKWLRYSYVVSMAFASLWLALLVGFFWIAEVFATNPQSTKVPLVIVVLLVVSLPWLILMLSSWRQKDERDEQTPKGKA
jgi:hypothetical protein